MRILFLHNNFPAQYRWLARAVAMDKNSKVVFGSIHATSKITNVQNVFYKPTRGTNPQTHHYLQNAENAVLHGQAAYRMARSLKQQGFVPNIICAHAGWGPAHFMKEIFPESKLLNYFEWFYNPHDSDFEFLPEIIHTEDEYCRLRMKNTALLTDLTACDWGVAPTMFQWSQLPDVYKHHKVSVLHDGVNTDFMVPNPDAKFKIKNLDLSEHKEIVTFTTRGMEPYRGFPQFMEAVSILQKRRPKTHFVIVGDDRVAYGRTLTDGRTYKQKALTDFDYDMSRLHFTGAIAYGDLLKVFQASSAHVYHTVPFVLSWSILEAMSAGVALIGSDTEPMREIIEDGKNGLLVDFFDVHALADRIEEVLDHKDNMATMRKNARQTIVDRYNYKTLLPQHIDLINRVASGKNPDEGGPYKPLAAHPKIAQIPLPQAVEVEAKTHETTAEPRQVEASQEAQQEKVSAKEAKQEKAPAKEAKKAKAKKGRPTKESKKKDSSGKNKVGSPPKSKSSK